MHSSDKRLYYLSSKAVFVRNIASSDSLHYQEKKEPAYSGMNPLIIQYYYFHGIRLLSCCMSGN